jgi:putative transcriptional regulator
MAQRAGSVFDADNEWLRTFVDPLYNYNMGRNSRSRQSPIYNRLPVLRAERSLSRQELAEAIGVNYQTIGYLERGDYSPSLELAFRLAEFFDLPLEAIFAREPFAPTSRPNPTRVHEEIT